MGNLYARRREWRKAIDSYLGALRAKPQFGRARLGLGIVMSASGDVAGALPHLRQAASDPDAAVRQEARELLQSLQSGKR